MIDKSKYNHIEIPDELDTLVESAMKEGWHLRRKEKVKTIIKRMGTVAAAFVIGVISFLNMSPVFAKAAYEIPVLGDLCRVFTFREYHFEDESAHTDIKLPHIENTGNTELEQRVNLEIQKVMNDCIQESEAVAADYYEAFVTTGGDPEDFVPIEIKLDYEVKCINEDYVSFVVTQSQTAFHAYNHTYYYNIDLESGRVLTLKEWFGSDYKEEVAESIEQIIDGWSEQQKSMLWEDLSVVDLISENTDFYINEENQAVVVFQKYEAARGAAGVLEFPIPLVEK